MNERVIRQITTALVLSASRLARAVVGRLTDAATETNSINDSYFEPLDERCRFAIASPSQKGSVVEARVPWAKGRAVNRIISIRSRCAEAVGTVTTVAAVSAKSTRPPAGGAVT
jgi:hypothetical protein